MSIDEKFKKYKQKIDASKAKFIQENYQYFRDGISEKNFKKVREVNHVIIESNEKIKLILNI